MQFDFLPQTRYCCLTQPAQIRIRAGNYFWFTSEDKLPEKIVRIATDKSIRLFDTEGSPINAAPQRLSFLRQKLKEFEETPVDANCTVALYGNQVSGNFSSDEMPGVEAPQAEVMDRNPEEVVLEADYNPISIYQPQIQTLVNDEQALSALLRKDKQSCKIKFVSFCCVTTASSGGLLYINPWLSLVPSCLSLCYLIQACIQSESLNHRRAGTSELIHSIASNRV